tara:strand:- start:3404 stop:3613 length:210 start_codon:yes stop_codon:yes gene_type:complete
MTYTILKETDAPNSCKYLKVDVNGVEQIIKIKAGTSQAEVDAIIDAELEQIKTEKENQERLEKALAEVE